jgi:tetratricopeptide (TPR) repeat protein
MTLPRCVPVAALALMALPSALLGGDDKSLPKKPDRPFSVAVVLAPRPAPTGEAEAKALEEVTKSQDDVRENIRDKRKDWFTLVNDPAQADILLELTDRGWEQGHGAVLRGQVRVFHLDAVKIVGQGALAGGFRYWHQAASDMTGRLQYLCQKSYAMISEARRQGVRPLAVAANDRGVDEMKKDQTAAAIASFDEAIRLAPDYALPHFNRGLALSMRKDWPASRASFDATIRIDPAHQKAYYYRAEGRREQGDLPGARADLDEAIRLDPKHADAWLQRAALLSTLGDDRAAIADLDRVIALDSRRKGAALASQGLAWERLGDTQRALAAYQAAVETGYANAALHYNRGRLLTATGDETRACVAFGVAALLDAKDADILLQRGICRARQGQLAQAIQDFSDGIRLKPDLAAAYYNRGLCYTKQGKTKLAGADRARALQLDPKLAGRK